MRNLEIGGGPSPAHPDWEQLDLNDWSARGNPTTHQCDMRVTGFQDGTFDAVYARNVLEHVGFSETQRTLAEWARILRVGGVLTVIVPSVLGIINNHLAGVTTWPECVELIFGAQTYQLDVHRAGFSLHPEGERDLRRMVNAAGLSIMSLESSHEGGGITLEAVKHGESKTSQGDSEQ